MLKPIGFRIFAPFEKPYISGGGNYIQHTVRVMVSERGYFSTQVIDIEFTYDVANGYWSSYKFMLNYAETRLVVAAAKIAEKLEAFQVSENRKGNYLTMPQLIRGCFATMKVPQHFYCPKNQVYYNDLQQKAWTVKVGSRNENWGVYVATDLKNLQSVFKKANGNGVKITEAVATELDKTEIAQFYDNQNFKPYFNEQ